MEIAPSLSQARFHRLIRFDELGSGQRVVALCEIEAVLFLNHLAPRQCGTNGLLQVIELTRFGSDEDQHVAVHARRAAAL
jgi:hypothetical protein